MEVEIFEKLEIQNFNNDFLHPQNWELPNNIMCVGVVMCDVALQGGVVAHHITLSNSGANRRSCSAWSKTVKYEVF